MIDAYRDRGWVPVPIPRGAKAPTDPAWQRRTLHDPWPPGDWNVGVLLGEPSGGLVDVDLDCPEAVQLAPAFLPPTAAFSRAPERGHRLYVCPGIDKREAFEHGGMIVELRSTGGQTVFPPSIHPSGALIHWHEPWTEPLAIEADDLRRRVGWVAALALVGRHWPRGGRHDAQLALAGCLLTEGWDEDVALEALCAVCRIAGDEDRAKRAATIRRTAERVAACEEVTGWGSLAAALPPEAAKVARGWMGGRRREVIERPRLEKLAEVMARSSQLERKECGALLKRVAVGDVVHDDLTAVARAVGAAYPEADVGSIERAFAASTSKPLRGAIERGQKEAQQRSAVAFDRASGVAVAKRVKSILARKGELAFDDGRLWRCEDGLWTSVPDHEIDGVTMGFDGAPVKNPLMPFMSVGGKTVLEVRRTLLPSMCARPGWFAGAPPGVAFQGTFVGAKGEAVLEPGHRCRAAYPWPWDPAAACSTWLDFLAQTYDDPAVPAFLQEFAGACLLGAATTLQKAVVLFGDGGTGKSVVVRVVTGIMPAGSTASIAPHSWQKEYSRARLVGVRLNAVSEMPATELFDSESVKAIISGDSVEAREPYGKSFDLHATAGHLFAANELPPVRDMSMGFWRRFTTITHERKPDVVVPGLAEALLEVELPGIVAWAVAGGRRALGRGSYALPRDDASEQWRVESDSVAIWLRDRCVGEGPTSTADLYDDYKFTAINGGQKPVSMLVFSRRLGRLASAHLAAHQPLTGPLHALQSVQMGAKEARVKGWTVGLRTR